MLQLESGTAVSLAGKQLSMIVSSSEGLSCLLGTDKQSAFVERLSRAVRFCQNGSGDPFHAPAPAFAVIYSLAKHRRDRFHRQVQAQRIVRQSKETVAGVKLTGSVIFGGNVHGKCTQ